MCCSPPAVGSSDDPPLCRRLSGQVWGRFQSFFWLGAGEHLRLIAFTAACFKLWSLLFWPGLHRVLLRYAAEAAAGPLDSASNLDQVQQARVREFRETNNLQEDSGFPFHFSSFEGARARGGDFLATAWAKVRAAEEERLVPMAAAALERRPPAASPSFRGPSSRADLPLAKRSTVRLRAGSVRRKWIHYFSIIIIFFFFGWGGGGVFLFLFSPQNLE